MCLGSYSEHVPVLCFQIRDRYVSHGVIGVERLNLHNPRLCVFCALSSKTVGVLICFRTY